MIRLNPAHPLNRGKLAHYEALPGLAGGPVWHNLVRPNPPAVLRGFTANPWTGPSHPGGRGCIQFDGSGTLTLDGSVAEIRGPVTLSYWGLETLWGIANWANGGLQWIMGGYPRGGGGGFFRIANGDLSAIQPAISETGLWSQFHAVYDGSSHAYYINGQLAGSNTKSGIANTGNNAGAIGSDVDGGSHLAHAGQGSVNRVILMNRGLSAAEVLADYLESQRRDSSLFLRESLT